MSCLNWIEMKSISFFYSILVFFCLVNWSMTSDSAHCIVVTSAESIGIANQVARRYVNNHRKQQVRPVRDDRPSRRIFFFSIASFHLHLEHFLFRGPTWFLWDSSWSSFFFGQSSVNVRVTNVPKQSLTKWHIWPSVDRHDNKPPWRLGWVSAREENKVGRRRRRIGREEIARK